MKPEGGKKVKLLTYLIPCIRRGRQGLFLKQTLPRKTENPRGRGRKQEGFLTADGKNMGLQTKEPCWLMFRGNDPRGRRGFIIKRRGDLIYKEGDGVRSIKSWLHLVIALYGRGADEKEVSTEINSFGCGSTGKGFKREW